MPNIENYDYENSTLRIISDFGRSGHPLGKEIQWEEVDSLCDALIHRLNSSPKDLNLTAASLKKLEVMLHEYYAERESSPEEISREETAAIVREVSAYWGKVCMLNTDGEWSPMGTLHATYVTLKGTIADYPKGTGYSPGNTAAVIWDVVRKRGIPRENFLFKQYHAVKRRDTRIKKQALEQLQTQPGNQAKELLKMPWLILYLFLLITITTLGLVALLNLDYVISILEGI